MTQALTKMPCICNHRSENIEGVIDFHLLNSALLLSVLLLSSLQPKHPAVCCGRSHSQPLCAALCAALWWKDAKASWCRDLIFNTIYSWRSLHTGVDNSVEVSFILSYGSCYTCSVSLESTVLSDGLSLGQTKPETHWDARTKTWLPAGTREQILFIQ